MSSSSSAASGESSSVSASTSESGSTSGSSVSTSTSSSSGSSSSSSGSSSSSSSSSSSGGPQKSKVPVKQAANQPTLQPAASKNVQFRQQQQQQQQQPPQPPARTQSTEVKRVTVQTSQPQYIQPGQQQQQDTKELEDQLQADLQGDDRNQAPSSQQMGQYFSKYRAKSVREIVAETTGQPFVVDDSWRTSIAIEGMQVETMARKRWKWAVTQILEERAAKKETQQQWVRIAEDAKKRRFRARGSQLILLIVAFLEVLLGIIFLATPDLRRENSVFANHQIQLVVSIQLFIAVIAVFSNTVAAVLILQVLRADPTLRDSQISWILYTKCAVILAYICCMGYPTTFRASLLALLVITCCVTMFVLFYIMWKYQFSLLLKQSATMPSVLKALLSLRQHAPSNESPMTIGLVEALLEWLSKNKQKRIVMPGGANFHLMGFAVLFLVMAMSLTAVVSMRTFQPQILANESLLKIATEADPLNSTILGRPYFWNTTGRFDHRDPLTGEVRKVVMILTTGVRYDTFAESLRFLPKTILNSSQLFKMKTQFPSASTPNWLCLISGVKPETSGYMGNGVPKHSYFDTLYTRLATMKLKRGIAASTWFAGFVQEDLDPFVGNGILGPDYNTDETLSEPEEALMADNRRHMAMLTALREEVPYTFFLTQYLHASSIAQHQGVLSDAKLSSSFHEATINIIHRIEELINAVTPNTVVVVVSDHGQLAAPFGGKGGVDPGVVNVPFWVYKKGWTAATPLPQIELSSVDVAPTVSMLLGIPVPRQNQGKFVESVRNLVYNETQLIMHREDLLLQSRTFSRYLAQLVSGGGSFYNDKIDKFVKDAYQSQTEESFKTGQQELVDFTEGQRNDYAATVGSRNVGVAFVVSVLIMAFMIFVTQILTMADPFAIFSKSLLKRPRDYISNPDVRAFWQSMFLCMLHYAISYVAFKAMFALYGYSTLDSCLLETPELLTLFLVGCLAPSTITFYILQRIVVLKYHQPDPVLYRRKSFMKLQIFNNRINYLLFQPMAFKDFEMAYLSRVYGMLVSCFFALLIVLSFARYFFIIPFVFLNQFIGELDWEARFNTLILMLITIPMVLLSLWNMMTWSNQRLNANSYISFEDRRRRKEQRIKEMIEGKQQERSGNDDAFKSKALQAGSKYAGIATRRRPNITPEMFDALEDEIAESQAEIHVLRRQIGEMDARLADVAQEEKNVRQQLQVSNEAVSQSFEDIYSELLSQIPAEDQPNAEYDQIKAEIDQVNQDLQEVEDMVLEHIKLRRSSIDPNLATQALLEKFHALFGDDFNLDSADAFLGSRHSEKSSHEKFMELQRKYDHSREEKDKLTTRIEFYQHHFEAVKVKREDELEQLNDLFDTVLKYNDKLKNQIVNMIGERNNLLQTLKSLKTQRNEINQQYKTEMFHKESKEESLHEELTLLKAELEVVEQEKEILFKEVANVDAQLQKEKKKLKDVRTEVEQYRKQLAQIVV